MELVKIEKKDLDEFFKLYTIDFPYAERKSKTKLTQNLKDEKFSSNYIYYENNKAGYINFWNFEDFIFIEHIAVLKQMRGTGIGTKFLTEFAKNAGKNIILEVEEATNEVAAKRIHFYERVGFVLSDINYAQPSYHGNGEPVPMKLMTYGEKVDEKTLKGYIKQIYKKVYEK